MSIHVIIYAMINIAILGRPNVGKSTLFNRLCGKRKSIVESTPGVTRDVNRETIYIDDTEITILDTGGLLDVSDDTLNFKVKEKALKAASSDASAILFVVDGKESHPDDKYFINIVRKFEKPIILVVNKMDTERHENYVHEFRSFGIEEIVLTSAEHARGMTSLIETIKRVAVDEKDEFIEDKIDETEINIAIVGKPNAGKSTLLNTLVGGDFSIVSDIAGTTRDPIDVRMNFNDDVIRLVDTAGIRRKKNVSTNIEYYSVNRAVKAIDSCDVAILLLDVEEGLTDQDKTIASLIVERRKGIIIAANKWDLREKGMTWDYYESYMKDKFPVLGYALHAKLCAKREAEAKKLLALAVRVAKTRHQKYETHALTDAMVRATRDYTITAGKAPFKIFYVTQIHANPPIFAIFCNHPDKLTSHYKRYLENKFREIFDFRGTPIVLQFRKRSNKGGK